MRTFCWLLVCLGACGSGGSVSITTEALTEHPLPGTLASVLPQLQRPIETCYQDALTLDGELAGSVKALASGSHGVIKVEIIQPANPVLGGCVERILSGQRLARELVDGDVLVGVTIITTFGG
ncbi:MAG: hypothetical protein EXR69_15625 [Myxococcales bacterium]|nr:hypothetical protein [Myxococcales bacterium]